MKEHVIGQDDWASVPWLRSTVRAAVHLCLPICVAAMSQGAVHAEQTRCISGDWVAEARRFVTEETHIAVPEVCVRFASKDQVIAHTLSGAPEGAHDDSVAAVYLPGTREILLAWDLDPSAPLTRSYLIHELVHAQQFAARKQLGVPCLGSLEADAYNIQALYLSTRGRREDAFLLPVLGMMQSACEYRY
jgi:hypothetical protein